MDLKGLNNVITDLWGKDVMSVDEEGKNKKPLTIKDAMIASLFNSSQQGETDEEKYKKFELAKKISASKDTITLESPDQKLIRTCSAKAWGVLVHGVLVDFIEGKK